ncbi:MAG: acyl carrier protein [Lachnospiraceae bacterium]|nr:acyl carrier protein [Lachnospiraceae bacterium]
MNREEVFEKVRQIFRDNFDDDELVIVDETNSSDIEDWDSIEHINLVIAMEKAFGLKFNIKEVGKLANVGEMVDLILSMLDQQS